MEITNVKIYKAKQRGPVLAYANVILDKQFMIRGITPVSYTHLTLPTKLEV